MRECERVTDKVRRNLKVTRRREYEGGRVSLENELWIVRHEIYEGRADVRTSEGGEGGVNGRSNFGVMK